MTFFVNILRKNPLKVYKSVGELMFTNKIFVKNAINGHMDWEKMIKAEKIQFSLFVFMCWDFN